MKEHIVEKLYWTIGEVSKELGVATSKLRFYEDQFAWIKIPKNSKGHRKIDKDMFRHLQNIVALTNFGMTLEGVRKAKEGGYIDRFLSFTSSQTQEETWVEGKYYYISTSTPN